MPIHIHPKFRAREEAMEATGLIQKLDSTAVTIQKTLESLGTVIRQVPLETYYFNGTVYNGQLTATAVKI